MDAQITSEYFAECVRKGFRKIFGVQQSIAAEKNRYPAKTRKGYLRSRSHDLEQALQNPDYTIDRVGSGVAARITYPLYIRFLDMKHLENYKIYNRPIWGILYRQTFQDIRYEFSAWLRDKFGEEIRQCYQH